MKTYKLDNKGNPTPEACRAVAQQLRLAVEWYPHMKLDMKETLVYAHKNSSMGEHPCGTVHCHAGAFMLGSRVINLSQGAIHYTEGAIRMAELLGFSSESKLGRPDHQLIHWARYNPDRWGNDSGGYLLYDVVAFDGAATVSGIADWWDGVADRTEAINNTNK